MTRSPRGPRPFLAVCLIYVAGSSMEAARSAPRPTRPASVHVVIESSGLYASGGTRVAAVCNTRRTAEWWAAGAGAEHWSHQTTTWVDDGGRRERHEWTRFVDGERFARRRHVEVHELVVEP